MSNTAQKTPAEIIDAITATGVMHRIDTLAHEDLGHRHFYIIAGIADKKLCGWIIGVVTRGESKQVSALVCEAMKAAYEESKEPTFLRECGCNLYVDGRFLIGCSGDATDVAIYPDGLIRDDTYYSSVYCHNIGTLIQQRVLLTGLLTLCTLAQNATA